jgi:hypothetical protein
VAIRPAIVVAALAGAIVSGVTGILPGMAGRAAADPAPIVYGPWEQIREGDGIVVHRRKLKGYSLHEFRGRGRVQAPIARLVAIVRDTERRTEWMDRCSEARAIARPTELSEISYNRTRGGFGISDRDAVLSGWAIFDTRKKEVLIPFRAIPSPAVPPVSGVVRMPFLQGHWRFWPVPGQPGATDVEYQVHADPGGYLPTFAVNIVSKEIPHKTIQALRLQAQRRSYPEIEQRLRELPEFQKIVEVTPR